MINWKYILFYSIMPCGTLGNGTHAPKKLWEFKNLNDMVSQSESMLIIGPVYGTISNGCFRLCSYGLSS
jgi:hypothetical protein